MNRQGNQDEIRDIQKLDVQELRIWTMSNQKLSLKITIIDDLNLTKSKFLMTKVIEKLPTWVDVKNRQISQDHQSFSQNFSCH